jgi:hypothetical protein
MTREPKLPTPLDDPKDVAEAILDAAVNHTRSKKVGLMSKVNTATAKIAPKVADKMGAKQADRQQYEEKPRHPEGTLERSGEMAGGAGQVRGSGGRGR